MQDESISNQRREALRAVALGAVAVGTGALAVGVAAATPEPAPVQARQGGRPHSAETADVLVIGAGTAGMPAAIQAADLGARVIVLDKNPAVGGEMHASGGSISAAQSKLQMARMIEDSPQMHYRDAMRLGDFGQDSELLRTAVDNAAALVDWLQELGVEFTADSPELVSIYRWSAPRTHWPVDNGRGVFKVLNRELRSRVARGDVSVRVDTAAQRLLKDEAGRVVGVVALDESHKPTTYSAKAVILATGGYASNRSLLQKFHPNSAAVLVGALEHSTGDGLLMAQEAGARLSNMDRALPVIPQSIEDPDNPGKSWGVVLGPPDSYFGGILVNKLGQRFISEDNADFRERIAIHSRQRDITSFLIFEETVRSEKPPVLAREAFNPVAAAPELDKQIAAGITVKKASSLSQLAAAIGVPPDSLRQTVDMYNGYVTAGVDLGFGRKTLMRLDRPPFYAIRLVGSILTTIGGVAVNHHSEVIDTRGRVIPGLYAAGESIGTGRLMGLGVVSGMSFGAALIFGRLAARNACEYARTVGIGS